MQLVEGSGPYNAPLLVIGEAPGRQEVVRGQPFIGKTGWDLRKMIRDAGLDHEHDVRYDNAIPYNFGTLPSSHGGLAAMVTAHHDHLNATLSRWRGKAILLTGRASMWRMLGKQQILKQHGSTYHLPERNLPVVISMHPTSYMRSKLESKKLMVEAAVARACRYATGTQWPEPRQYPSFRYVQGDELDAVLDTATKVALDCEFDRRTGVPFLIGLQVRDGEVLHIDPCARGGQDILKHHMKRDDLLKIMHHAPADIGSLSTINIKVYPPYADTMVAQASCYSDFPQSLASCALHYFDGWAYWKDMAHDDPAYNAIDVNATWCLWPRLVREMTELMVYEMYKEEALPISFVAASLEARGLQTDRQVLMLEQAYNENAALDLRNKVIKEVNELYTHRGDELKVRVTALSCLLAGRLDYEAPRCTHAKHASYDGMRKKKFIEAETCSCKAVYEAATPLREANTLTRKERAKLTTTLTKWAARTFDPGNNHDVRWLLYDKAGLDLNRHTKLALASADSDSIAKLLAHKWVQARPESALLLRDLKTYQHLTKRRNTFLDPTLDPYDIAHPRYRAATGTGRMAGGASEDNSDKQTSEYAFNALNIPEDTRRIYVPHREVRAFSLVLEERADKDPEDVEELEEAA